jgi:hypothetical protein
VRISMGKVALGVAGRADHSLKRLWLDCG